MRSVTMTILLIPVFLLLPGCQSLQHRSAEQFLTRYSIPTPHIAQYTACESFGCHAKAGQSYTVHEWQQIEKLFTPPADTAMAERQSIRRAVALMETFTGAKNNTSGDTARNGGWLIGTPQLDCVAETINTTVALMLLQQNQLLQHHTVSYPRHRGLLDLTAPHYSAAIYDLTSKQSYVVDSWFYNSGELPVVVNTEHWQQGYDPEG